MTVCKVLVYVLAKGTLGKMFMYTFNGMMWLAAMQPSHSIRVNGNREYHETHFSPLEIPLSLQMVSANSF